MILSDCKLWESGQVKMIADHKLSQCSHLVIFQVENREKLAELPAESRGHSIARATCVYKQTWTDTKRIRIAKVG